MDSYNTDILMTSVYRNLCHDMRTALKHVGHSKVMGASMSKDIADVRTEKFLLHDNLDPYTYKWCIQVNSFLKRYTFHKDVITPNEREELTNAKFLQLQETLATNYWRPRSLRCHKVLCRTRSIVRRVLNGFDPQGLSQRGQFGTKATVGCPAKSAYLDEKLTQRQITGSALHLDWITSQCEKDHLLSQCIKSENYECITKLAQVNVPKKCDIDRGINPNTLVGSYYSSALGDIVVEALRKEGLNISMLQHRHGILARRASTTGKLVTADLSDASHGFLSHLINATMPRKWYRAIMFGVIRNVEVADRVYRLESIMTMGIGFTFPIQTLLFYCLLKALCDLSGIKGLVSVYGDDLIYPKKLHPYVVGLFKDLGFKLNLDKTFVESHFRESCGSDYYRGVAVRPFSPEGKYERIGRVKYAAFCYKLLNGILHRWEMCEVKFTCDLLMFEICRTLGCLYVVPQHFPDHSGWKAAESEYKALRSTNTPWWFPSAKWFFCSETYQYEFPLITCTPGRRYVAHMLPYYWEQLRSFTQRKVMPETLNCWNYAVVTIRDLPDILGEPLFKWRKKKRRKTVSTSTDCVRRRKYATVASKDESVARYNVAVSSEQRVHEEQRTL